MKFDLVKILLVIVILPTNLWGQKIVPVKIENSSKEEFYSGTITLTSGESIDGEIRYDFETQVLYQKRVKTVHPFLASSVQYFECRTDKKRRFYSLIYEGSYLFFELLFEKNDLAVLSNYKRTEIILPSDPINNSIGGKSAVVKDRIFLVNGSNGLMPFLEKKGRLSYKKEIGDEDRLKYRLISKDGYKEFFENDFEQINDFIKEHSFDITRVRDLIQIIEFFAQIKSN